ncbi:unnamed protein product [Pedinophyceae sp. YPF-701]|nr:unnamed protein product [Pedinophyceae sp. YPF-701]
MRYLEINGDVPIPEGVTVEAKARKITVKGPRGELHKELKHMAVDIFVTEKDGKPIVKVAKHFGTSKQVSSIRTACSHIKNMILGVTKGFQYKMRLVYAHFPININLEKKGTVVEIRNFLGEKRVRIVNMLPGVTCEKDANVKDQLVFTGNSIENVSRSCALINNCCLVRNKDIRKFLDGIYVSESGVLVTE